MLRCAHLPAQQHFSQVLQVLGIGGVAGVHVAAGGADGCTQVSHLRRDRKENKQMTQPQCVSDPAGPGILRQLWMYLLFTAEAEGALGRINSPFRPRPCPALRPAPGGAQLGTLQMSNLQPKFTRLFELGLVWFGSHQHQAGAMAGISQRHSLACREGNFPGSKRLAAPLVCG